jgi:hypothetical protein
MVHAGRSTVVRLAARNCRVACLAFLLVSQLASGGQGALRRANGPLPRHAVPRSAG